MNTLKDYVNFKLTHADKVAEAEGYPLTMQNCKKYKKMKDLKVYGNSFQDGTPTPENPIEVASVGDLVTDETDANYGKYKIPVVARGINLFCLDKTNAKAQTINGITFTPLEDERVHIEGKAIDESSYISFYYNATTRGNMPIKRGTYKAKQNPWTWNGLNLMFGCNNGSKGQNINSMNNSVSLDMDNGYISSLYIGLGGDALKREWDDIIELQLMEGNQNLPYEPYVEPVTTNIFLDEPLRKLGDYADYIDFKENKVVRIIKENQLKSTSTIVVMGRGCVFKETIPVVKPSSATISATTILCTHYKVAPWANIMQPWGDTEGVSLNQADSNFGFYDSVYASDLNTFKDFLDNNDLHLYYVMSEHTEEPIILDLPKLTAKTTIIEVDTSLAPSNAYGKYIKK